MTCWALLLLPPSRPLAFSIVCLGCAWAAGTSVRADAPTTAFYYGRSVPPELCAAYEQIVVEPAHVPDPRAIERLGAVPVAYLSVGEVGPAQVTQIDRAWALASNRAWASLVMDLRNRAYRAYLMRQFEALHAAGYRRFFLDTLDSYLQPSADASKREAQRRALVEIVHALVHRYVGTRFVLNRGFEILPDVFGIVHGVAAESLFDGWDASRRVYTRVTPADRTWLVEQLQGVRERYGLPVIAIDYRPAGDRRHARETAQRIRALGFQPWVGNATLTNLGTGTFEIIPRRVLILTNPASAGARLLAPVIEYLGYIPESWDVAAGLPDAELADRSAGVVTWLSSDRVPKGYAAWLSDRVRSGVGIAIFGALGFNVDATDARVFGLSVARAPRSTRAPRAVERDGWIGFETEPARHPVEGHGLAVAGPQVTTHLALPDDYGAWTQAIATTGWGGIASSHVLSSRGLDGELAWVLNPFEFLRSALRLPEVPVPDLTTESGRRIALFVVQAPGLGERARLRGRPWTYEVLREHVLSKVDWPHAIDTESVAVSPEDRRAARGLLKLALAYPARLHAGDTDARGPRASLTRVQGSLASMAGGLEVAAPISGALAYLEPGSEAYPYEQILDTFRFTGEPRRLKPIALIYPAFVASSPGGLGALQRIYATLERQSILPLRVDDYAARVSAFREQVVVRDLDGAFEFRGGSALRSVRVPRVLGLPNLERSRGVTCVRTAGETAAESGDTYVGFGAGERRVELGAARLAEPHVREANQRIERFVTGSAHARTTWAEIELRGEGRLEIVFGGLPPAARCELRLANARASAQVGPDGAMRLEHPFVRGTPGFAEGVLRCTHER